MAITLTMTDNGDGTGAIATVAGSIVTSTNTLTKSLWSGISGSLTFTAAGNRTGDGTIAASASVGTYVWLLTNNNGGTITTVIAYSAVTGGASSESVLYRLMLQMQTQIIALGLSGILAANIVVKWLPRMLNAVTDPAPEIVICPAPLPETDQSYLTATDHIGYPVLVAYINAQNQDFVANLARNTLGREKIRREFISRGLVGVPEVQYCKVEPQAIISPAWFDNNVAYLAQVFRFSSRETRGN